MKSRILKGLKSAQDPAEQPRWTDEDAIINGCGLMIMLPLCLIPLAMTVFSVGGLTWMFFYDLWTGYMFHMGPLGWYGEIVLGGIAFMIGLSWFTPAPRPLDLWTYTNIKEEVTCELEKHTFR